jgi:enediyne biosynthesis protein E4
MFRNQGKGLFEKVSESLGPDFMRPVAVRGLATADFDNDGDLDVALNNRGDYPGYCGTIEATPITFWKFC